MDSGQGGRDTGKEMTDKRSSVFVGKMIGMYHLESLFVRDDDRLTKIKRLKLPNGQQTRRGTEANPKAQTISHDHNFQFVDEFPYIE
jgi:hypothetical protein